MTVYQAVGILAGLVLLVGMLATQAIIALALVLAFWRERGR